MHDLLLKRCVSQRMFTRLAEDIHILIQERTTTTRIIERRLAELRERWIELQTAHDFYIVSYFTNTAEITKQDEWLKQYRKTFYDTEAECDKLLYSQIETTKETDPPMIKLERFKFPIFDGDIRKYAKFKTEFIKFVEPQYSSEQLPFVLKRYLCESVRKEVENFDQNIDLMWMRLDKKYGALRKLIDSIIADIKSLPVCDNSPTNTLNMIRTIETAYNELNCIDAVSELLNSTMLGIVEQHMPSDMLMEWVKLVSSDSHENSFSKLLPFLDDWKLRIEYNISEVRNTNILYSNHESTSTRKCLIHRECNHPVWRCRIFLSLTPEERKNIVESRNACTLCLDIGHTLQDCSKLFACNVGKCNGKHNRLLHSSS